MNAWLKDLGADALALGKFLLLVGVPAALLLTHIWYDYQITHLGYQISEETSRHETLVDKHRELKIEAAVQGRSERLANVAREKFGLEQIDPEQIIMLDRAALESEGALHESEHAQLGETVGEPIR